MGKQPFKESETVELKKSLAELKQGLVSMAAILNKHQAGTLWFGVRNNGTIAGIDANEKTLRDLSQSIAAHIEPKIFPRISEVTADGKRCIKIEFAGDDTPYFAYGRAFMRVADEDRQLSVKQLKGLIAAQSRESLCWDNQPGKFTLADLDQVKIKRFVERAKLSWDTPENVLSKLELIKDGKLLNPARLFFGIKPIQLRCAVFMTTESSTIVDRHDFDGDILELIEEAQKYILKNIHIGMRIKGLYREDVPEISVEAIREAIINAFCHRDYRDPDYVQVAIFKDRVEIRNPGRLYGTLTLDDLRKGNVSQRRNPLIADLFRRIEMVEAWGRGMPLILKYAPDVVFRETGNLFIVAFNRPSFLDQKDEGEAAAQETTQEKSNAPKETPEKPQRSDSRCPKETALHQHQGTGRSMRHEYSQCTAPHQQAQGGRRHPACGADQSGTVGGERRPIGCIGRWRSWGWGLMVGFLNREVTASEVEMAKTAQEAVAAKPLADLEATWGAGLFKSDRWIELIYSGV